MKKGGRKPKPLRYVGSKYESLKNKIVFSSMIAEEIDAPLQAVTKKLTHCGAYRNGIVTDEDLEGLGKNKPREVHPLALVWNSRPLAVVLPPH